MNINLKPYMLLCLGFGGLFTPPDIQAELLKTKNFEYEAGSIYGKGDWLQATANTITETIDLVNKPLTYPGYQDEATGLAVQITPEDRTQAQGFALKATETSVVSGTVYASFLFKVEAAPEKGTPFFISFAGANKNGYVEYNTNLSQHGRIFLKKGSDDSKFKIMASKNSAATTSVDAGEYEIGQTYLAVMSYEFVDGTKNDAFKLWIDPPTDGTIPAPVVSQAKETADVSATYGMQGIRIYQHFTTSINPPQAVIDAIRVSTDWASLFNNGGGNINAATITASPTSIDFADGMAIFQGRSVTKSITVKGENLTGPLTLTCADPAVTVSPATISAEEAMAEGGKEVSLTFKAGADILDSSLTISSEGAEDVNIALSAYVMPVTDKISFAALNLVENETYEVYRYTGSMAKVSYVNEITKDIYVQDMTGAIRISYAEFAGECDFKAGDKVKDLILWRIDDAAGPCFQPTYFQTEIGTVVSSGNEVPPVEATIAEINASKEEYLYRLVTLTDVTLDANDNTTWSTTGAAASQTINGTTSSGRVRTFHATDLIGTQMPGFLSSVTGISTSKGAVIITTRGQADVATAAPEMEVSFETLADASVYQEINKPVEFGLFTVKATALSNPITIWFGGKNATMFSADREEIPAGTGIYQVKVTYTPTATGSHEARINFETTPAELNYGAMLRAKAYDPANPPTVSVDAAGLTDFVAAVGETQEQTVKYTVANGLDYGTVKVEGTGFIISSGSMMKEGTYDLKITFRPQQEGDHTAVITFSTPMAEDATLTVKGSTSAGPAPQEKEGDELTFEGPALTQYATDFSTATADNKPISLDGWKNVAYEGQRAWWSATLEDGNKAAKVVAYDSQATENTEMIAMLLSPRLDFKNAQERLLCFNVMGRMMTEGMNDYLMVAVIDALEADTNPENVTVSGIDGLGLPCTPDENDQWARYVLDADSWNLPDEFYIAFVFQSLRGKESSAQYFIDDFSWGRTDMPFIRSSHQILQMTASTGNVTTSEAISIEGHNLTEPIKLSLGGTHAANFTLSTAELPAEGGQFTLDFASDEVQEHTAIVTLLSGSDARADILVNAATQSGIGEISTEATLWGDNVSVYDLEGHTLLTGATTANALKLMKSNRGTLYIVRASDGTAYKYIAK